MNYKRRRVVITGTGVVSPLGNSTDTLFRALASGRCGIRKMTEWENSSMPDFFGAPVALSPDFVKTLPRSVRRSMSPLSLYAACAAKQAAEQACLTEADLVSVRTGCVIGSTMGGSSAISEAYRILGDGRGLGEISSMQFFKCVSHTAAFNVSHMLNIQGVVQAPSAACASGVQAIGQARDLIAYGTQDVILCGGAEELAPEVSGSFEIIFAGVSGAERRPETCSRPFDAGRTGLVCGEGAGIVVLEELEHARKRGAVIFGEVLGYATCGCGTQISQSDAPAIARCLEAVYEDAGISRNATDYVNAHATSTVQGDLAEAQALKDFFGTDAPPVSSLKGHLGHTLGASGSLELIASLKMLEEGLLIPNLNFERPGEGCEGLPYVREARRFAGDVVLKNSFAFGGINASLLIGRNIK